MIDTKVVSITPTMALEWLEGNIHNRTLRQPRVMQYAKDMQQGQWHLPHQGVAFDAFGKLVDGQHRLWAIVEADTKVDMLVTRNVDMDTQLVIDDHLTRTGKDALDLTYGGESIGHRGAAVLSILVHGFRTGRPSHVALANGMERYRDALEFIASVFPTNRRMLTQASVQAVIARAFYHVSAHHLRLWAECFLTGNQADGTTWNQYQCATLLRNFLLFRQGSTRKRMRRADVYEKTERSISAFVGDESISKLFACSDELYPLPDEETDPSEARKDAKRRAQSNAQRHKREARGGA